MSGIAIKVQEVAKRYRIGLQAAQHDTFVSAAVAFARKPLRNLQRLQELTRFRETDQNPDDVIWALRDVSFEVKQGEVLGVIGRNGAGKSTLLKILARITYPTHGRVEIRGRVSSLLEVGTGFHPELTGRENVYLNGTILGMSKAEIDRKFDEIVDFSGIEKFIDTPVKRYSSGMGVRLAFAVAAHMEPEVLLVDEVLAVGDAAFQRKSLGKMESVAKGGRTVLFVSHRMSMVQSFCTRALFLENGQICTLGDTQDVVSMYLDSVAETAQLQLRDRKDRQGNQEIILQQVEFWDHAGKPVEGFYSGQDIQFIVRFHGQKPLSGHVTMGIAIYDHHDQLLFACNSDVSGDELLVVGEAGQFILSIPKLPLPPGRYTFDLRCLYKGMQADYIRRAGYFNVDSGDFFGSGRLPDIGKILVPFSWHLDQIT